MRRSVSPGTARYVGDQRPNFQHHRHLDVSDSQLINHDVASGDQRALDS
jgi:hypothetical protein